MPTVLNNWLKPKPAGVAIRRQGDAARNLRDWAGAEAAYRRYVDAYPGDAGIWVQLGHALKEQGKLPDAIDAYERAASLPGDSTDANVHLTDLLARMRSQAGAQPPSTRKPLATLDAGRDAWWGQAATAEAAGDWSLAAAAMRRLLEAGPGDAALLLRYGHALRQLGLFAAAASAFRAAGDMDPADAGPLLCRASLAAATGSIAEAARLLEEARGRGADVSESLARLPAAPGVVPAPHRVRFDDDGPQPAFRVFLSTAIGAPRSEGAVEMGGILGLANYSYTFVARCYMEALDRLGVAYEVVGNPEYIPDVHTRSDSAVNIHLGFYPPDAPRLLKGAYNIAVVAWEFERLPLPGEIVSYHAFADPNAMLRLPDELWSLSTYGTEALHASGQSGVHSAPAPVLTGVADAPRARRPGPRVRSRMAERLDRMRWVPLGILPQMLQPMFQEADRRAADLPAILADAMGDGRGTVFLSILNVHDYRKQIRPVVEAFLRFTQEQPAAVLLLKLSVGGTPKLPLNDYMFRYQMTDGGELPPTLVSDRVWLTADVLSRDEMTGLYDLADFYISAAHGEGQNLPLIEAMARGCVPVAVDHTAMRDYIDDDDAVVIRSTLEPFNTRLADRYRMAGLRTYYVSPPDALDALRRAVALSPEEYAAKSAAAHATVRRVFGLAPFEASLHRAVQAATAHFSHGADAR